MTQKSVSHTSLQSVSMAQLNHPGHRHSPSNPLHAWIADDDDPVTARLYGHTSSPPSNRPHIDVGHLGDDPNEIGTSQMVDRTDSSLNDSLPGFTFNSSAPSQSVISSSGRRALDHSLRVLDENEELVIFPIARRPQEPILQCPHAVLGCRKEYHVRHIEAWIAHSLEHFVTYDAMHQKVNPPKQNDCPLCEKMFFENDAVRSWRQRMLHVAAHHEWGHTLSHTRPSFGLLRYLWQQRVITDYEYRELVPGNKLLSRQTAQLPSPPDTVVPTDTGGEHDDEPCLYTMPEENRSRRRRERHA